MAIRERNPDGFCFDVNGPMRFKDIYYKVARICYLLCHRPFNLMTRYCAFTIFMLYILNYYTYILYTVYKYIL